MLVTATVGAASVPAAAAVGDSLVVDAREALRRGDRARLTSLRAQVAATGHPLAMWVDYWELKVRLSDASTDDVDAFYARWPDTYVEDRLRNDWLLELGRRRDWPAFARDYPRFRMNDDRDVTCYALLTQHQSGQDVRAAAREAWYAQRDGDIGCQLLATSLREAEQLTTTEVWTALRIAIDANRPRAARATASLLGADAAKAVSEILDSPARYLTRRPPSASGPSARLGALAVMRMAANEPEAAARQLEAPWVRGLDANWASATWATLARQAALRQQPQAPDWYQQAFALHAKAEDAGLMSDDTLAWGVRAALRKASSDEARWTLVSAAIDLMPPEQQRDPAWTYWKARALLALAAPGAAGEGVRAGARRMLESIGSALHFYGKLAVEELGRTVTLPPAPTPLTDAEREAAGKHPGFMRALDLIKLGLRSEGVREWNYSLRGMADRELLAAAQLACDREVWDRCINTSDRTRNEVDLQQRFPTPFRAEVVAASRDIGLDPAYVYGLIRQESRFITDARSHVGASGLMQIMPATARWTARKIGLDYRADMATDRDVNLRLGTAYLKLVLDDFGGSAPMAAAAYNAGPNRPRRWREGAVLEPAAWAETIPFNETRDYVKKVLSNTELYAALLQKAFVPALKARLGAAIGPRDVSASTPDKELP